MPSKSVLWKTFASILNVLWNIAGVVLALISVPTSFEVKRKQPALVFRVSSLWFAKIFRDYKNVRAVTVGQVVMLSKSCHKQDLSHELVHVSQAIKTQLLHPMLYAIEAIRFGYIENKYEKEAYEKQASL